MISLGEVPAAFEHPETHIPPVLASPPGGGASSGSAVNEGLAKTAVTPNSQTFKAPTGTLAAAVKDAAQELYRVRYHFRAAIESLTGNRIWVDDKTFDPTQHREIK